MGKLYPFYTSVICMARRGENCNGHTSYAPILLDNEAKCPEMSKRFSRWIRYLERELLLAVGSGCIRTGIFVVLSESQDVIFGVFALPVYCQQYNGRKLLTSPSVEFGLQQTAMLSFPAPNQHTHIVKDLRRFVTAVRSPDNVMLLQTRVHTQGGTASK